MSKSNSLNRSSSGETENDPDNGVSRDPNGYSILEEGNENDTAKKSTTTTSITTTAAAAAGSPNNPARSENTNGTGEVMPSSPPPSYEFVLEETRMRKQEEESVDIHPVRSSRAPEIMHTSSKEFYKAVAKQLGITCKMSDHCRCYDCQSHYFDCEYEQNEQEKTDGGLGAGTPVFLNEVMHGTACAIL